MFEFAVFAASGNYCPARSAAAAGLACPVAFYCNGGSEDKQACPEGKLSLSCQRPSKCGKPAEEK